MYGFTVRFMDGVIVDSVSVNKFRDNLKTFVEQIVTKHVPLKVTRRSGEDFVVISADDWEREQETLYVLQNKSLMKQIAASLNSHGKGTGYQPSQEELDEITGI
jgi:antitoxin YefM